MNTVAERWGSMAKLIATRWPRAKVHLSRILVLAVLAASLPQANGATLLKHIVRLKGQEEITIQGMGLVVGLVGTGDGPSSKTPRTWRS
jgi:flagellar basal body P-ring protein FlgI